MYRIMRDGWRGPLLTNRVEDGSVNCVEANDVAWSRVNLEEASPGVITPLSWSFTDPSTVTSSRIIFGLMGVMSRREMVAPLTRIGVVPSTVFFGRMALNVDYMRTYIARIPGADPDDFERSILGSVRGRPTPPRQRWRSPWIIAKLTLNSRQFERHTRQAFDEGMAWWRHEVAAVGSYDLDRALALFDDATRRHAEIVGVHSFGFLVGQGHFSKLSGVCVSAGLPGHELHLTGSGAGTIETSIVDDVAAIASGGLTVERFVERHGYRGPDEGELSSTSWREDPSPIVRLAELYSSGKAGDRHVAARFQDAVEQLCERLPPRQRRQARRLVAKVVTSTHLREIGKANFVRAKDVARAAARRAGDLLVQAGQLDERDDVFLLTRRELDEVDRLDLRAVVAQRRQTRAEYTAIELPDNFIGLPAPHPPEASALGCADNDDSSITGVAASPGVAEGTARVVIDPSDFDDFEPDDILVCELTDPAWAPLLQLAAAAVIDIGGPLSHGAIVARELGIPAVIGTTDGTKRIGHGARVRVDGSRGVVTILAGPDEAPPIESGLRREQ